MTKDLKKYVLGHILPGLDEKEEDAACCSRNDSSLDSKCDWRRLGGLDAKHQRSTA